MNKWLILFCVLVGCDLSNDDIVCRSETNYLNIEAYLLIDGVDIYISDISDDLSQAIPLCFAGEISDTIGFESIYSINGTIVEDCNTGTCLAVSSLGDPFCKPSYVQDSVNVDLFERWYVSHLFDSAVLTYPSCNYNLINLDFVQNGDSTMVKGYLGVNTMTFGIMLLRDSTMVVSNVSATSQFIPPYARHVENEMINYFIDNDTLHYAIIGNEMRIRNKSEESGLVLYNLNLQ